MHMYAGPCTWMSSQPCEGGMLPQFLGIKEMIQRGQAIHSRSHSLSVAGPGFRPSPLVSKAPALSL